MNTKSLVLILAAQFMICGFISAQKSDKEASQEILIGGNFFKDDLNEASLKQLKDFIRESRESTKATTEADYKQPSHMVREYRLGLHSH